MAEQKDFESLLVGNAELLQLKQIVDRFNIFEAVGVVRQELKHSSFLSFILNPNEKHGLGDTFLKIFLQSAIRLNPDAALTTIDLELWDLRETVVETEWRGVDILIVDHEHHFVVIIENKVDSGVHSDQLRRYYETVSSAYPGFRMIPL